MSVEFHCPSCGKLIRAPDNAGGRHGKCPYCQRRVYVPAPPSEAESIELAPIDEQDERREEELQRESLQITGELSKEKAGPAAADSDDMSADVGGPPVPETEGDSVDLGYDVERFLLAMRDSRLDEADAAVASLSQAGTVARDYIQDLMSDDALPRIENVPLPVLKGLLRTLLGRLE